MNRNRLLVMGLVAVVLAGLLTFVAYKVSLGKVAQMKQATTQVVVATKDLPLGTRIDAGDIALVGMPKAGVPDGAFIDPKPLVGRGVIATMAKNEVVLPTKIAGEKAGAGLPSIIPPDMRAVSVQVNDVIAVAGFVVPGTRVDVLVTGSPSHNAGSADVMTTTVLENVVVLAAGQKIEPNAEGKAEKVPVITLLVSPEDAQKLTLASSEGKIQLALRNPTDAQKKNEVPVRNAALYKVAAAPEVSKSHVTAKTKKPEVAPAIAVYSVEVIRGDKREVLAVNR